jgi:hypothetical protein
MEKGSWKTADLRVHFHWSLSAAGLGPLLHLSVTYFTSANSSQVNISACFCKWFLLISLFFTLAEEFSPPP